MLKQVTGAHRQTRLADLGAVRVQGVDAVKFLQGQVSNDVASLAPEKSVLAGLHNAQGRAVALLRLVLAGDDEVLGILPRELAGVVAARLAKFVLRAKAKVSDASLEWEIAGVEGDGVAAGLGRAQVGAARHDEERRLWVCVGETPERWLVVSAAKARAEAPETRAAAALLEITAPESVAAIAGAVPMSRDEWRARDIADGIPQVYGVTSEAFVAQMLNLDVVGGISFDKGCYTGQEVIARAHYRGKVKRRMQRFRTQGAARLSAGDSGTLNDGRAFKVVDAVSLADGRCEFLAVAPVSAGADDAAGAQAPSAPDNTTVNAEQLTLPYSLPG